MATKLYPPQLEGALPAFYKNYDIDEDTDKRDLVGVSITIPFGLNRAVVTTEIAQIALRLRTSSTNTYILADELTNVFSTDEGWATWNLKYEDVAAVANINESQYYRAQIAFVDRHGTIGYYSTVGIIKCVTKPTVSIVGFDKNKINVFMNDFTGEYQQDTYFGDSTEKAYSYIFNLWDEDGELIATSGEQLHDTTQDVNSDSSSDFFKTYKEVALGKVYRVQYTVTTLNGLTVSTDRYKVMKTISVDPTHPVMLHGSVNYENGYIDLYLQGELEARPDYSATYTQVQDTDKYDKNIYYWLLTNGLYKLFTGDEEEWNEYVGKHRIFISSSEVITWGEASYSGTFLITRASDQDDYFEWREIARFAMNGGFPSDYHFQDFTVEQGVTYKYALQQYNIHQIYSNKVYLSDESGNDITIKADFEDMFLYDGKRQLKIRFNPKVTSFKNSIPEQKIETIGSKYPFIFRNGSVCYKEFPIAGMISYQMDDAQLFLTQEELEHAGILEYDYFRRATNYDSYKGIGKHEQAIDLIPTREPIKDIYTGFTVGWKYTYPIARKPAREQVITHYKYVKIDDNRQAYDPTKHYFTKRDGKYLLYSYSSETWELEIINGRLYEQVESGSYPASKYESGVATSKAPHTVRMNKDLTTENMMSERFFKLKVLDWLTDGKVKLFRSPGEGNYLVRLLNVSMTPQDPLGRMLHQFTCTGYEIAELTYDNLKAFGIVDETVPNIYETHWGATDINHLFDTEPDEDGWYKIETGSTAITGIDISDFAPGDQIKIVYNDAGSDSTFIYTIGVTGTLDFHNDERPIAEIYIRPNPDMDPYNDFARSFIYSYIGQRLTQFDVISNISVQTNVAEQFIGPKKNLLDTIYLRGLAYGQTDPATGLTTDLIDAKTGHKNIYDSLVSRNNVNYAISDSAEKFTGIKLDILQAHKRELIPIFAYDYPITDNTKFAMTPFGRGYVNNRNILDLIQDAEIQYAEGNIIDLATYTYQGGVNIYDLYDIYDQGLKVFKSDSPLNGQTYYYLDNTGHLKEYDITDPTLSWTALQAEDRIYKKDMGRAQLMPQQGLAVFKTFIFDGSNWVPSVGTDWDYFDTYSGSWWEKGETYEPYFSINEKEDFDQYGDLSFNDAKSIMNSQINTYKLSFGVNDLEEVNGNPIGSDRIYLYHKDNMTLYNLGPIDKLTLGNGVYVEATLELRIVDYDIEESVDEVLNARNEYLQSKDDFATALENVMLNSLAITEAKVEQAQVENQIATIKNQLGVYDESVTAVDNVLEVAKARMITQKQKLDDIRTKALQQLINYLTTNIMAPDSVTNLNAVEPAISSAIYDGIFDEDGENKNDYSNTRAYDNRQIHLDKMTPAYPSLVINNFNYIYKAEQEAISQGNAALIADREKQITALLAKIGEVTGTYDGLFSEDGEVVEGTIKYYEDLIAEMNKNIDTLEKEHLQRMAELTAEYLQTVLSDNLDVLNLLTDTYIQDNANTLYRYVQACITALEDPAEGSLATARNIYSGKIANLTGLAGDRLSAYIDTYEAIKDLESGSTTTNADANKYWTDNNKNATAAIEALNNSYRISNNPVSSGSFITVRTQIVTEEVAYRSYKNLLDTQLAAYKSSLAVIESVIANTGSINREYGEQIITNITDTAKDNLSKTVDANGNKYIYGTNTTQGVSQVDGFSDMYTYMYATDTYVLSNVLGLLLDEYNTTSANTINSLINQYTTTKVATNTNQTIQEKMEAAEASYQTYLKSFKARIEQYELAIDQLQASIAELQEAVNSFREEIKGFQAAKDATDKLLKEQELTANSIQEGEALIEKIIGGRNGYVTRLQKDENGYWVVVSESEYNKNKSTLTFPAYINDDAAELLTYLSWLQSVEDNLKASIGQLYDDTTAMSNKQYAEMLRRLINAYEVEAYYYCHHYGALPVDLAEGYEGIDGVDQYYDDINLLDQLNMNIYNDILYLGKEFITDEDVTKAFASDNPMAIYAKLKEILLSKLLLADPFDTDFKWSDYTMKMGWIELTESKTDEGDVYYGIVPVLIDKADELTNGFYPSFKLLSGYNYSKHKGGRFSENYPTNQYTLEEALNKIYSKPLLNGSRFGNYIEQSHWYRDETTVGTLFPIKKRDNGTYPTYARDITQMLYTGENPITAKEYVYTTEEQWHEDIDNGLVKWLSLPPVEVFQFVPFPMLYDHVYLYGKNDNIDMLSLKPTINGTPVYLDWFKELNGALIQNTDSEGNEVDSLNALIIAESNSRSALSSYMASWLAWHERREELSGDTGYSAQVAEQSSVKNQMAYWYGIYIDCRAVYDNWDANENHNNTAEKEQLKILMDSAYAQYAYYKERYDTVTNNLEIDYGDELKALSQDWDEVLMARKTWESTDRITKSVYSRWALRVYHYINLLYNRTTYGLAVPDGVSKTLSSAYSGTYNFGIGPALTNYKNSMLHPDDQINFTETLAAINKFEEAYNKNYAPYISSVPVAYAKGKPVDYSPTNTYVKKINDEYYIPYEYINEETWAEDVQNQVIYLIKPGTGDIALFEASQNIFHRVESTASFDENTKYYILNEDGEYEPSNTTAATWVPDKKKGLYTFYGNGGIKELLKSLMPDGYYVNKFKQIYLDTFNLYDQLLSQQLGETSDKESLQLQLAQYQARLAELERITQHTTGDSVDEAAYIEDIYNKLAEYLRILTVNYVDQVERRYGIV